MSVSSRRHQAIHISDAQNPMNQLSIPNIIENQNINQWSAYPALVHPNPGIIVEKTCPTQAFVFCGPYLLSIYFCQYLDMYAGTCKGGEWITPPKDLRYFRFTIISVTLMLLRFLLLLNYIYSVMHLQIINLQKDNKNCMSHMDPASLLVPDSKFCIFLIFET